MAGGVALTEDRDWLVSGWIFGELVDRALARAEPESDVATALHEGEANGMVVLYLEDPPVGREVAGLLTSVARDQLDRRRNGESLGTRDDDLFVKALADLVVLLAPAPDARE